MSARVEPRLSPAKTMTKTMALTSNFGALALHNSWQILHTESKEDLSKPKLQLSASLRNNPLDKENSPREPHQVQFYLETSSSNYWSDLFNNRTNQSVPHRAFSTGLCSFGPPTFKDAKKLAEARFPSVRRS